jgi:uncharacterized protein (TIGR04255 family)
MQQTTDTPPLRLRNPPIVEAVLDIECDLPPGFDLPALETLLRERFRDRYPKFRPQCIQEREIETTADGPPLTSSRVAVQALLFLHEDEKQLVQVRAQGFSFNRLAPYSTLDDYLAEIERTWNVYVDLVAPIAIRATRLHYVNRILLPMQPNGVNVDEFLRIGPGLPDEETLMLSGFLSQLAATEKDSGHHVNLVLANQIPTEENLPVILDIAVTAPVTTEPRDWPAIRACIESLRRLKNRIFLNTLTPRCMQLFQA